MASSSDQSLPVPAEKEETGKGVTGQVIFEILFNSVKKNLFKLAGGKENLSPCVPIW